MKKITVTKGVKKGLKITGFTLLGILLLLITIPIFFQKQILEITLKEANKMLDAKVSIENCRLSLIRNFPNPTVVLKKVLIENKAPFEGDTLLQAQEVMAGINLFSLFSDQYHITKVVINDARVHLLTNQDTLSNWSIYHSTDTVQKPEEESAPLNLKFDKVSLSHIYVYYNDIPGAMKAEVKDFNFTLSGNLSADQTVLKTAMEAASIDFAMNKIPFAHNLHFKLKSKIDADLNKYKFTVLDNEIALNDLILQLEGWVAMPEEPIDMDIKLKIPKNDFKNILSLVPAIYAKDFKEIKTEGKVALDAYAKGHYYKDQYPAFGLSLLVNNAKFQYPSLPAGVTNIEIDAKVANKGGSLDNTIVDINKFALAILENPFSWWAHVITPISDPNIDMNMKGTINLADIKKVYPLDAGQDMSGMFTMDLALKGLLSYVEKEQYDKFVASGNMLVKELLFKDGKESSKDIRVPEAQLLFTTAKLNIPVFKASIGRNSVAANGYVQNYLPYIFKDGTLKGNFTVNSTYLNVNDFLSDETPKQETPAAEETPLLLIVLPDNLDVNLQLKIEKLIYDNINLDNALLGASIKNSKLTISKLAANLFAGSFNMSGSYATPTPKRGLVDLDIAVANISTQELCNTFALFDKYLPFLKKSDGKVSLTMNGNTAMDEKMSIVLEELNMNGKLAIKEIKLSQLETMNSITEALKLEKYQNLHLRDLEIPYSIVNGKMFTKPFNFKIDKGNVAVEQGSVGLDKSVDYTAVISMPMTVVPANTLNMANSLAAKATAAGFNTTIGNEIKFALKLTGKLPKPKVSVGLDNARNMIESTVEQVKEQVKEVAKETVNKALEEAQKQADALVAAARKSADDIVAAQKKAADKILADAQAEADKMINSTKNPLEKAAKKVAADAILKEARKQADQVNLDAQKQGDKLIADAQTKGNALIEKAKQ
ncbi:MAG: AsmA family protein [Bacteroidales bacterium]|jgi:F0F1-type ATP synthase membrane subunit b/b'|nr:AsmA family protein [Bacteroidales bacterium]